MSPTAIIGAPQPVYDYDIAGPWPPTTAPAFLWGDYTEFALGVVGRQNFTPTESGSSLPRTMETNDSIGGGAVEVQVGYKGIQAREIGGPGVGRTNIRYGGLMVVPITDATGMDPAYANPSWRRVQRFQWDMAMDVGATCDAECGMAYAANPGGIVGNVQWFSGAATIFYGGFGVVGDGAGDWDWISLGAGPPPNPVTETVSLAAFYADSEEWNTFEILTISAAGNRPASLELYVNGVLALTRNWLVAPILFPLGPTAGVEVYHYIPIFQGGGGGSIFIGDWHFRCGRFLPDGRELLT